MIKVPSTSDRIFLIRSALSLHWNSRTSPTDNLTSSRICFSILSSSSHLVSAADRVRKNVGHPSCLTIDISSLCFCCQNAGEDRTVFNNLKASSSSTILSRLSLLRISDTVIACPSVDLVFLKQILIALFRLAVSTSLYLRNSRGMLVLHLLSNLEKILNSIISRI